MTRRGRISQASLDELQQAVPLAQLIGESVALRMQAGRWVGLCPFHSESSPSFYVFEDHYHCFGCGAHGKAIDFEMHRSGAPFPDAAAALADRYGVTLQTEHGNLSAADEERHRRRMTLAAVLEEVSAFYQRCLAHKVGTQARDYLVNSRSLSSSTLERFSLGYAPPQNTLEKLAARKLWPSAILEDLGLVRQSALQNSRRTYDLLRHRAIVPIHDERGTLVGFGGRELPGDEEPKPAGQKKTPKYLNSPESEVFAKSSLLFNFHRARKDMVRKRSAVVVEGYMDVMALFQEGFENVVGVLGTALTPEHLHMLSRCTEHVILCFDNDAAGRKAMMRSFERAWPLQILQLSAVQIPSPAKDPDDVLRTLGPATMRNLIDKAPPLLRAVVANVTAGLTYREERIHAVRQQVLATVESCRHEPSRHAALKDIAEAIGLDDPKVLMGVMGSRRGRIPGQNISGGGDARSTAAHHLAHGLPADGVQLQERAVATPKHALTPASSAQPLSMEAVCAPAPTLTLGSAAELRLLVLLLYAAWSDLPRTLAEIVTGAVGDDITSTLITLRSLQTVLTPPALRALDELISHLVPGAEASLRLSDSPGPSALAEVLMAIPSQNVTTLERFGLSPRRLSSVESTAGRFQSGQTLLSAENFAFVKFLCKDAELAKNRGTIASQIGNILVGFEIVYLDRELTRWSLGGQGAEGLPGDGASRYRRVLEERARRLKSRAEPRT